MRNLEIFNQDRRVSAPLGPILPTQDNAFNASQPPITAKTRAKAVAPKKTRKPRRKKNEVQPPEVNPRPCSPPPQYDLLRAPPPYLMHTPSIAEPSPFTVQNTPVAAPLLSEVAAMESMHRRLLEQRRAHQHQRQIEQENPYISQIRSRLASSQTIPPAQANSGASSNVSASQSSANFSQQQAISQAIAHELYDKARNNINASQLDASLLHHRQHTPPQQTLSQAHNTFQAMLNNMSVSQPNASLLQYHHQVTPPQQISPHAMNHDAWQAQARAAIHMSASHPNASLLQHHQVAPAQQISPQAMARHALQQHARATTNMNASQLHAGLFQHRQHTPPQQVSSQTHNAFQAQSRLLNRMNASQSNANFLQYRQPTPPQQGMNRDALQVHERAAPNANESQLASLLQGHQRSPQIYSRNMPQAAAQANIRAMSTPASQHHRHQPLVTNQHTQMLTSQASAQHFTRPHQSTTASLQMSNQFVPPQPYPRDVIQASRSQQNDEVSQQVNRSESSLEQQLRIRHSKSPSPINLTIRGNNTAQNNSELAQLNQNALRSQNAAHLSPTSQLSPTASAQHAQPTQAVPAAYPLYGYPPIQPLPGFSSNAQRLSSQLESMSAAMRSHTNVSTPTVPQQPRATVDVPHPSTARNSGTNLLSTAQNPKVSLQCYQCSIFVILLQKHHTVLKNMDISEYNIYVNLKYLNKFNYIYFIIFVDREGEEGQGK